MAGYIAAVAGTAGVPLFIRTKGDLPQLTFPVVGSLNGVHLFASNSKATLRSCVSGDVRVVWRSFHDSITLIAIAVKDTPTDARLLYLLELVFNCMVLLIGLPSLLAVDDLEKLKRELRSCYRLIDFLMSDSSSMSPLTQCIDVLVESDSTSFSDCLDSFTKSAQSGYGCLLVGGRVCVATENWWDLDPIEIIVLSLFTSSLPLAQSYDIPVFLPHASNTVAHRLLVFTLVENVTLVVLCDSEPPLTEVQKLAHQFWSVVRDKLCSLAMTLPRCIPLSVTVDSSVLALCLVNLASHRCVCSLLPPSTGEVSSTLLSPGFQGVLDNTQRKKYLMQFFNTVADNLLPLHAEEAPAATEKEEDKQDLDKKITRNSNRLRDRIPHKIKETYVCAKAFKGYALHRNTYNLFILFDVATPTYALRRMSNDVFDSLIQARVL